jgi:hypothetical protein
LEDAKGSGTTPEELLAWRCITQLGASQSYNGEEPLWTKHTGPTAAGLLRDPNLKLINLLSSSRRPDGKSVDSARLWSEVVRCGETWPEGSLAGAA